MGKTTISLSVCRCDETVEFNDFSALLAPNKVHMVPNTKHWEETFLFPCSGEVQANVLQIMNLFFNQLFDLIKLKVLSLIKVTLCLLK